MRQAATDVISAAVVACAIVAHTAGLILTGLARLTAWVVARMIVPSARLARRTTHRNGPRLIESGVATTGTVATIVVSGFPIGLSAPAYEQSSHTPAG